MVKMGDAAIIKLLTPADTVMDAVVNKYEYKKIPENPLAKNIGISLSFGSLIFLIKPIIIKVIDAITKRITINETGL